MYAHGGRKVELSADAQEQAIELEAHRLEKAQAQVDALAAEIARYPSWRRSVHRIAKTSAWSNVFMLAIVAYALMLAFQDPLRPSTEGANAFIEAAEPVFTVVFTVDMAGGLIADGARRFFSDSWNVLDAFIVGAGWVDMVPGINAAAVKPLRMVRLLRPLRTLTKVESMRLVVSALISSIPGLANVMALAAFICFIFALFGLKLWIGTLRGRCGPVDLAAAVALDAALAINGSMSSSWMDVSAIVPPAARVAPHAIIEGWGTPETVRFCCPDPIRCTSNTCPDGQACIKSGNPQGGFQSFDNIGSSTLVVFQAMTAEGWTTVMDALLDVSPTAIVAPYFTFLMIFGGLFVTNYLLAECCVVFTSHIENLKLMKGDLQTIQRKKKENQERDRLREIELQATLSKPHTSPAGASPLALAPPPASPAGQGAAQKLDQVLEEELVVVSAGSSAVVDNSPVEAEGDEEMGLLTPVKPAVSAGSNLEMTQPVVEEQVISVGSSDTGIGGRVAGVRTTMQAFITNARIEKFLNWCIGVNFVILAAEYHGSPNWYRSALEATNLVLTIIFACELVIQLSAFGMKFFRKGMNCLDAFIVVTSVLELVFLDGGGSISALRILRLIRILRSAKMIKPGSPLKKMLETAIDSLSAVANFGVLLFLLIYIYTLLGMSTYGGKLFEEDGQVPRANYDTFLAGFTAVFQVASRENWHVLLYQGMASAGSGTAVLYYVSLLVFTNYILLALFIGTLLQNFQVHFTTMKQQVAARKAQASMAMMLVAVARTKFLRSRGRNSSSPSSADGKVSCCCCLPDNWAESSCFILQSNGRVRQSCTRIAKSPAFERAVLFCIIVSSILLAVEHPNDPPGLKKDILGVLDIIFTAFFTTEMVVKMISLGVVFGPDCYLRSWWNVLDGTVVIISILNFLPGGGEGMKFFRVLRTIRALRPLQAVKRWPGLRMVMESIAHSIPSIMIVNSLGSFFMLVFGTLFVQLFAGALHFCNDGSTHELENCVGTYHHVETGLMRERHWLNNRRNFDNIFEALLVMFELLTLEEWDSIMYSVMDATDAFHGPVRDNSRAISLVFMFYIIAGSFFILNLFVGVIVSAYNEAKAEADAGQDTAKDQEKRRCERIKEVHHGAMLKYTKMHDAYASFKQWQIPFVKAIFSTWFEYVVLFAICANVIFMALEYESDSGRSDATVAQVANEVFAYIFLGEMVMKHLALGVGKYWSDNWNRFDGTIVTISMVEIVLAQMADSGELPLDPTVIRLFRIFRVARFVRLAEKAQGIKNLIQTFLETLPYLVNVAALLSIFLFIYAVVGVHLFTNVKPQMNINERMNFADFPHALSLLLRITTGEGWSGAMRDCQISTPECGIDSVTGHSNCGDKILAPIYFVTFMLICTYISLNVIVAVILYTFFDLEGNTGHDKVLREEKIMKFLDAANVNSDLIGEDADKMPAIPAVDVGPLLLNVGPPLGVKNNWTLEHETMPKLHQWMRRVVKDKSWQHNSGTVEVEELLRFCIVFGFDVDVHPPVSIWKKPWQRLRHGHNMDTVGKVAIAMLDAEPTGVNDLKRFITKDAESNAPGPAQVSQSGGSSNSGEREQQQPGFAEDAMRKRAEREKLTEAQGGVDVVPSPHSVSADVEVSSKLDEGTLVAASVSLREAL